MMLPFLGSLLIAHAQNIDCRRCGELALVEVEALKARSNAAKLVNRSVLVIVVRSARRP